MDHKINTEKTENYVYIFLVIFQIAFQIIGGISYNAAPAWIWSVCDASILMIPLIFGWKKGIIACIPNIAAEMIWFIIYNYRGALIHGFTFLLSVILLGLINRWCNNYETKRQLIIKTVAFEFFLLLEEFAYRLIRVMFGIDDPISAVTWNRISVDLFSVGNIVCLAFILLWIELIEKEKFK